jgi:hypothetical protein
VVEETNMTTQTTHSRSFTQSFDARLLSWGAIGIGALIVAAFISIAAPRFAAGTARDYDAASSSRWPMS